MFFSKALLLAATGALASPFKTTDLRDTKALAVNDPALLMARGGTPSSLGWHGDYYYVFWTDGGGTVNYLNGDNGTYNVNWENCGNFFGGKGWNPGSSRTINFNGTFNTSGNGYLSIYGWTKNPLVEYYIIESFGTYDPSSNGAQKFGNVYIDGSNYTIARWTRVDNIGGVLRQYYSVRENKRLSGSVDVGAHFQAWKDRGLSIGAHDWQIVAVEGYQSSGSASVAVW